MNFQIDCSPVFVSESEVANEGRSLWTRIRNEFIWHSCIQSLGDEHLNFFSHTGNWKTNCCFGIGLIRLFLRRIL